MNHSCLVLAALALFSATAQAGPPLASSNIIECTPALCGSFPANRATMSVDAGSVTVAKSGLAIVTIEGLRDKATGKVMAFKQLGLHYGTLFDHVDATIPLGNMSTDGQGNYSGPVTKPDGHPYKFAPGRVNHGSFYINDPSAPNTQFVTGFVVQ